MINKELTKSILEAVDTNFSEQIKFTKQLMEFRSVRGHEKEAQNFVYDTLQRFNYKMD